MVENNNTPIPSPEDANSKNQPLPPPIRVHLIKRTDTTPLLWEKLRRFLLCNPLYLASAALLLYSCYLVAADSSFLGTDVSRLAFNLGSLQVYEILLVVTAIWLARRAVWYDSTLLAGLENLLLLVPFILLSEAALIDRNIIWPLCAAAAVIAVLRLFVLRWKIPELNFPSGLAALSLVVLVVNAVLPVTYRILHQSKVGTLPDWGAAYQTNQVVWWLVVPAICALGMRVPISAWNPTARWPERNWLPLGFFILWLAGTGTHLYSLTYVYDFALRPDLLAPCLWTLAWVIWLRTTGLLPNLVAAAKNSLLIVPLLATLLAAFHDHKGVFVVLTSINVLTYLLIFGRDRTGFAMQLAVISMVTLLAGLPESWAANLAKDLTREKLLASAAALYVLIWVSWLPSPKLALLGTLLCGIITGYLLDAHPDCAHWVTQACLVYLLLHSLRWDDSREKGVGAVRWLAAIIWVAHSLGWTHWDEGLWKASALALPVITTALLLRHKIPAAVWLPLAGAAALILLGTPTELLVRTVKSAPAGLLVAIASFVLFGLGTVGALTKHRWAPGVRPSPGAAMTEPSSGRV
jgi:hypothetical protein